MGTFLDIASQQSWIVIILAALLGVVVLFIGYQFVRVYSRRQNRVRDAVDVGGMPVTTLKKMEQKGLLSPEETRRVREAMARQFLDRQKEEDARRAAPPVSPLQALAIEAERAEMKLGNVRQPASPPTSTVAPPPPAPPPDPVKTLPPHLQSLATRPDSELEDLCNAGFLSPAEKQRILGARTSG